MAFVKNHQIIDSFVIAKEIIHSWKQDRTRGLLVKLDFEKVYDSVDHELFVRGHGFNGVWIELDELDYVVHFFTVSFSIGQW